MLRHLRKTMHPARYQGPRRPPYFEGWYFKLVDARWERRFAFVPGVFLGERRHAFVQVLDGRSGKTWYHAYPIDAFHWSEDRFEVRVGQNRFTRTSLTLAIERPDQRIHGTVEMQDPVPWPVTCRSPGVMGWYAWVPFMQTYHGVLSLDHALEGSLTVDGTGICFDGGRGYIEKDWGRSFPSSWVWMQSNHFETPGTSLTGSQALVPWLFGAFDGFIVGLWHQGRLYRFATHTGADTERLSVTPGHVHWRIRDDEFTLQIEATRPAGAALRGPSSAAMDKRVMESLDATLDVRLHRHDGTAVFEGVGRCGGLEVYGSRYDADS